MSSELGQDTGFVKISVSSTILIIMVLSLICRYQWLPYYPFHEDGVATIAYIKLIAAGQVSFEQLISQRSPLGNALLALPLFFVEASLYSYRLTNLVFFAGVLILLVLIGRQTGNYCAGVMAMVFVAFSSLEGLFVGFVRFYLVFQFFFLLVWYLLGQYFFLRKKHAGFWLFLVFLLGLFVHKLSLQLFLLAGLAIVMSGFGAAKRRLFWLSSLILVACAFSLLVGPNLTLAPSDFNELMIGEIGSVFSYGESWIFYDYFKTYVPLGWSFVFCGSILSLFQKDRLLAHYYVGFLLLFIITSLLAPGDSPHYISHLFPAGVFCGMLGLVLCIKAFRQSLLALDMKKSALVLALPVLTVGMLFAFDLDGFSQAKVLGKGPAFLDERGPHDVLKRYVKEGDMVLSTDPGLTRFYLEKDNVMFLRQRVGADGTFSAFSGRDDDSTLIDSVEKLNILINNTQHWTWLYGNKKYQLTVGPQMTEVIDHFVKKVIYYDEQNNIFIIGLKK